MKIGPVDIRNHAFVKRAMRGLDEGEVRAYLDLVADGLQEAILEAEELRSRIDRLEREIVEYRGLEQSMRESLLSASKITDDRLAQAEKEAQILIKDAEVQGDKILLRSREEAGRLRAAIDDLRRQRTTYVERFRALLRSQMKILEASVAGFDPEAAEVAEAREAPPLPPAHAPAPVAPPPMPQPSWTAPSPASHLPPPVPPSDPPLSYLGESGLFSATGREGDPSRDV
ncbi:MAG: DivIVA domain-containing protein [bacterium]